MIAPNTPEIHPSETGQAKNSCQGCPNSDQCGQAWNQPRRGPLSPAGLSLSSIAAFVLPWLCAIAGVVIYRSYTGDESSFSVGQILAACASLAVGVVIAYFLVRVIRKHFGRDTGAKQ
ncbi:MAG: hypothetical protein JW936_09905 [Sedimentisphaerales bacterium]|nr:hypothetical protein [Sedimentisphaerales bacterium]